MGRGDRPETDISRRGPTRAPGATARGRLATPTASCRASAKPRRSVRVIERAHHIRTTADGTSAPTAIAAGYALHGDRITGPADRPKTTAPGFSGSRTPRLPGPLRLPDIHRRRVGGLQALPGASARSGRPDAASGPPHKAVAASWASIVTQAPGRPSGPPPDAASGPPARRRAMESGRPFDPFDDAVDLAEHALGGDPRLSSVDAPRRGLAHRDRPPPRSRSRSLRTPPARRMPRRTSGQVTHPGGRAARFGSWGTGHPMWIARCCPLLS